MSPARRSPSGSKARAEGIASRLHSAAIHLLRRLRTRDVEMELTGPTASALSVVVFGGPITLGALATAEQVRPPTISRLVKQLEAEGLVTREVDEVDGRVQRITATPKGRKVLEEGRARRVETLTDSLKSLPPAKLRALEEAVEILEGVVRAPWR